MRIKADRGEPRPPSAKTDLSEEVALLTPKGRFWNTRHAWGTAQDIEDLQRAASGQRREPGPYAESVKDFRKAIQDRHMLRMETVPLG